MDGNTANGKCGNRDTNTERERERDVREDGDLEKHVKKRQEVSSLQSALRPVML